MHAYLRIMLMGVVLTLLVACSGCASVSAESLAPPKAHVKTAELRLTTKWTDSEGDWTGWCSGTAYQRHVYLTDEHCMSHTKDGLNVSGVDGHVLKVWLDGHDHAFVLTDVTFDKTSKLYTGPVRKGDNVHWTGNPDGMDMLYRKGYIAGFLDDEDHTIILDANGYFGDSGSGVYNAQGQIIATINQIRHADNEGVGFSLMYAFPLQFTDAQMREIDAAS